MRGIFCYRQSTYVAQESIFLAKQASRVTLTVERQRCFSFGILSSVFFLFMGISAERRRLAMNQIKPRSEKTKTPPRLREQHRLMRTCGCNRKPALRVTSWVLYLQCTKREEISAMVLGSIWMFVTHEARRPGQALCLICYGCSGTRDSSMRLLYRGCVSSLLHDKMRITASAS